MYVRSDGMAREWAYVLAVARLELAGARLELAVSARSSVWYGAHAAWSLVGFVLGLTWSDTGLVRCCTGLTSLVRVVSDLDKGRTEGVEQV